MYVLVIHDKIHCKRVETDMFFTENSPTLSKVANCKISRLEKRKKQNTNNSKSK